jgi:hypothetical protein
MDPRIRIHTKMSWIRNTGALVWRGLSTQPFLNESTAMRGRSSLDLPRWWRGWANFTPSAVRKFTCCRSDSSSRFTRSLYSCNTKSVSNRAEGYFCYAGKTHNRRFRGVFRGGQDSFDPQIVLNAAKCHWGQKINSVASEHLFSF